jgi:hypothetical protein
MVDEPAFSWTGILSPPEYRAWLGHRYAPAIADGRFLCLIRCRQDCRLVADRSRV